MLIGEKIKFLRKQLGITQEELAIAVGNKKQTIHKYEMGIISNIPASKIKDIAEKLGTTPAYLMGWEEHVEVSNITSAHMATIGERIKTLRKNAGLTQSEFGDLFGIVKSTVSSYEHGNSFPDDDIKVAICKHFNVSLDYLLGISDEKQKPDSVPAELMEKISSNPSRMEFVQLLPLLPDEDIEYLLKVAKSILERPKK